MGLTDAIARSAARRAHVLLVEVPGHWRTRATVERAVLTRGWSLAASSADADLIAVCGTPRPRLEEVIELAWHQMPGPRVRVDIADDAQVDAALDQARARLLDTEHHRHDARSRPAPTDLLSQDEGHDHGSMDHGGDEGHDHEPMDHGAHGGMEMTPGGIALAQGGEDRDGLEMDVLNVRLGPVLPHWPAGLVLRCALQGDVIKEAQAESLDAETQQRAAEPATEAARTLDNVVSLLALAGWADAAAEARRVRDAMLESGRQDATMVRLDRLRRKVTRSRVLRWSLRGARPLDTGSLERHDLPSHLAGDSHTRLLGMLDRAGDDSRSVAAAFPVDKIPRLVAGLDVAAARLVVASLDVHELQPGHVHDEVSGG